MSPRAVTAAFDNIDIDQICTWINCPGGKLLTHPFGHEVRIPDLQPKVKKKVFAAIAEITQSKNLGFYAPKPGASFHKTPTMFMIHNLMEVQRQILLNREIWSSKLVTFRITTIDPVCPNYIFSIFRFTTKSEDEAKDTILQVWESQSFQDFLTSLSQTFPEPLKNKPDTILQNLTNTLKVKMLNTKDPGNASAPTFNVYIQANLIPEDGLWCLIRNYYASQKYALPFQEHGCYAWTLRIMQID